MSFVKRVRGIANGMFGVITDEPPQVSDAFDMRTTVVESARRTTTRAVEATVWEGRDAEAFKQRYASEVAAMMQQLEQVLQLHRTDSSIGIEGRGGKVGYLGFTAGAESLAGPSAEA